MSVDLVKTEKGQIFSHTLLCENGNWWVA